MKLELRNWDKGACPFIPIRAAASPYSQFSYYRTRSYSSNNSSFFILSRSDIISLKRS